MIEKRGRGGRLSPAAEAPLAQLIEQARLRKGWGVNELGRRTRGVSASTISQLRKGTNVSPDDKTMEALAASLGLTVKAVALAAEASRTRLGRLRSESGFPTEKWLRLHPEQQKKIVREMNKMLRENDREE